MAHYAFINDKNIVTQVIVGRDEDDLAEGVTSWEEYYGERHGQRCLRTSYNTYAGEHIAGGTPFRGNYAGIGYRYDEDLDAFIPPRPFASWTLSGVVWEAPIPMPDDEQRYVWVEVLGDWVAVPEPAE